MFDIRLREYTPAGVRGRVIPTLEIDNTDAESATATLTFSTSALVAERLEAPFVVGLEYTTGSAWARPRNDLYIVLEDAEDANDKTDVMKFTAQSYVGWLLSWAIHWWNTDSDGKSRTYDMTPGRLVRQLVTEAQVSTNGLARGWAPMLTTAFTDTADSLGQAWKPDDQIKMEVDLWRSYANLFQSWIEQGHFEWWAEGTTLMLARLGTGADLTSKVVLGGPGFESAPAKTDFKGTFSTIVLIPDKTNAIHEFNAGADTRFGALETSMSMSGVGDPVTARRLAQPIMKENRAKKLELSFDWTPAVGGPAPWADFTVGDLITARRKVGRLSQRVVGIQVSKRDGVVSARAIVGSKLVGLQAKIAKRVGSTTTGGIIGGSGSGIPYNPGVKRPDPIAPSGLVVTSAAYFDATGTAFASVTATCSTVTTDVLGGTVKVKWYELWAKKNSSGESWTRLATTTVEPPSMTYTGLLAGESWSFRVRAYADENVISAYSPIFSLVLAKDTTPPPVPAPPSGTSQFGQVIITHSGLTADGQAQPVDFSHFNVWMSTTSGGAGTKIGELQGVPDTFVTPTQTYGQARWYWVTAQDKSGNKSAASTRISVTTKSLVPEDITQDVMDAISDIVSQDVVSNLGGTISWATRDPAAADGTGKPVGAMWYRRNTSDAIVGMWEWSGSIWLPRLIGPDPILAGAITEAKIATGAVLEAKLADAAVATAKLKDSAITEVKIANLAVGTAKIADAAILEAKIGNLAVSTAKIADAAIVTAKIGDAAITTAKIGDAQITNAKIVTLDAGKISTGFLDAARIAANTITTSKMAIADLTNYMDNPNVSTGTLSGWDDLFGKWEVATSSAASIDRYLRRSPSFTGTATMLNQAVMAVRAGQRIRLSALTYCDGGGTQTLGVQWINASGGALSNSTFTVADSGNWVERWGEWDVPANAFGARFRISDNGATGSTTRIANPRLEIMGAGQLIVDGSIIALKIATNAIESDKIAANAITADKIDAGAITTVKLAALAITTDKLAADAIVASKLDALAITSKHTITGAKFQTTSTANRGIEITSQGLTAYNSAGQSTITISATTGDATFSGTIRNRISGPRVQINSSDTRGQVWFYTNTPSSTPASITSDPSGGEGLLLFGGSTSSGVRRATLQLYEQGANNTAGWFLGQVPTAESSVDYMGYVQYANNTNLTLARNSGHYVTLASTGTTHLTGNGVQVNGNFVVTGSKSFGMKHPTKAGLELIHASTESPHNGVEYWSDGFLTLPPSGGLEVILPEYFEALTAPDHRVVILTSGSADTDVWSTEVLGGRFTIHGAPGAKVSWLVKARRVQFKNGTDVLAFATERPLEVIEPVEPPVFDNFKEDE